MRSISSYSAHYGLEMLNGGDPFSTDGQKYTFADRAQIDRLVYQGAEGHVHNGAAAGADDPTVAGTLATSLTGGSISAGTTLWYEYTLVDASGAETLPSPPVSVTLADGLLAPSAPVVSPTTGTGTLPPGDYFYALSAYTGANTNETLAPATGYVYLPGLGECTITFPTLPTGADGFNLYRKGSNELNFSYLDSSTASVYVDDGTVTPSCTRSLPTASSSAGTNSVTFTLPSAVPDGFTWNLYRTTQLGQWTGSLLANVVETVSDTSTVIVTTYVDVGNGTLTGSPPLVSQIIGSPSQINLATDVVGQLPQANMAPITFPLVITFAFPGPLTVQTGTSVWTSEFATAEIVSVRASLARGSSPSATPVTVDVLTGTGTTPTYATIFPTGPLPEVAVGEQIGAPQAPPTTTVMALGDSMGVDITGIGGGASPTDHDLTVNIYLLVTTS